MWKVGPGGKVLFVVMGLAILAYTGDRYLAHGRLVGKLQGKPVASGDLSLLDFPPGAASPVGDLVSVPLRPMRVAVRPRGSTAALLLASGGPGFRKQAPASRAFGIDLDLSLLRDEEALVEALLRGGDREGADAIALSVDRLAGLEERLREARPKAFLLLSRSRGYEALAAAAGLDQVQALEGKRVAVPEASGARYFLTWRLAQALLPLSAVELVPAASSSEAARLFRESRVDAAVGLLPDLAGPVRERGGKLIASTTDAPHLVAEVLVARGDFLVRFPDAARRLTRAVLEQAEQINVDATEGARQLARHTPLVVDAFGPFEVLRLDPPATLAENLAFFGLEGDLPVRFEELYQSAGRVWRKLGAPERPADAPLPVELDPLAYARENPPVIPPKPAPRPPEPKPVEPPKPPEPAVAPDAGELPDETVADVPVEPAAEPVPAEPAATSVPTGPDTAPVPAKPAAAPAPKDAGAASPAGG